MNFHQTAKISLLAFNLATLKTEAAFKSNPDANLPAKPTNSLVQNQTEDLLGKFLGVGKTTDERIAAFKAGHLKLDALMIKSADILLRNDCQIDINDIKDPKHAYLLRSFALSVFSVENNLRNHLNPHDTNILAEFTMYLALQGVSELEPKLYKRQALREMMGQIHDRLTTVMREDTSADVANLLALNEVGYLSLGDQLLTGTTLIAMEATFLNKVHIQEKMSATAQCLLFGAIAGLAAGYAIGRRQTKTKDTLTES